MAALENHRTTPAESGGIKKHYSSYNRTSGSRCCIVAHILFLSFSLSVSLAFSLSESRAWTRSSFLHLRRAGRKMRNDRGSIQRGACLKFMNDFTATSPIATRHKRANRTISRERRKERKKDCVAHIRNYTSVRESREKEG